MGAEDRFWARIVVLCDAISQSLCWHRDKSEFAADVVFTVWNYLKNSPTAPTVEELMANEGRAKAIVYGISANLRQKKFKQDLRDRERLEELAVFRDLVGSTVSQLDRWRALLFKALSEFSPEERALLSAWLKHQSFRRAAAAIGLDRRTFQKRFLKLLERLERELDDE